jgi:hypothetical protein
MVIFRYRDRGGWTDGGYELISERDKQILNKKIEFNERKIRELLNNNGDPALIVKYQRNIELYKKKIE